MEEKKALNQVKINSGNPKFYNLDAHEKSVVNLGQTINSTFENFDKALVDMLRNYEEGPQALPDSLVSYRCY